VPCNKMLDKPCSVVDSPRAIATEPTVGPSSGPRSRNRTGQPIDYSGTPLAEAAANGGASKKYGGRCARPGQCIASFNGIAAFGIQAAGGTPESGAAVPGALVGAADVVATGVGVGADPTVVVAAVVRTSPVPVLPLHPGSAASAAHSAMTEPARVPLLNFISIWLVGARIDAMRIDTALGMQRVEQPLQILAGVVHVEADSHRPSAHRRPDARRA
jgi:hypothetical protein